MGEREGDTLIKRAHEIAVALDGAVDGPSGVMILAMAMGIFLEGQDGSHREMLPMAEALNECAQTVFDQMRAARSSGRFGTA